MEKFFHHYKGIIIQNDDPEFTGRVKVWVPSVNLNLYEGWTKDRDTDKKFTNLGKNLASSLTPELLNRLRIALPWAEIKHPIFGMGSCITYNADRNFGEKTNGSDNSIQQTTTNKDKPETPNNNQQNTTDAIKSLNAQTASIPVPPVNNNSLPSYVTNAANNTSSIPTPIVKPTIPKSDNIAGVQIIHQTPQATATNKFRNFTEDTKASTPNTIPTYYSLANIVSAPIYHANLADFKASGTTSKIVNASLNDAHINVDLISNSKITSSISNQISYNGNALLSYNSKTGQTQTIQKSDILSITMIAHNPTQAIDNISDRLGKLGDLLKEYTTVPSIPSSNAIVPPTVIASPRSNSGGSGSNLNQLIPSPLLPFNAIKNSVLGGNNPSAISRSTQGTKPDPQTDPKATKNPCTQIPSMITSAMNGSSQGDKVKGMISIPAVGAHVSVSFEGGDPQYPIVDGIFYNQEDMKGIHDTSS